MRIDALHADTALAGLVERAEHQAIDHAIKVRALVGVNLSLERGETRRMPWYGVDKISWESGTLSLLIAGKDESGSTWTFKVPLKSSENDH